jgi:hypothetical protein
VWALRFAAGWICEPAAASTAARTAEPAAAGKAAAPSVQPDTSNNTIWFKVVFSEQPRLQVTYLTSYENIGSADLFLYSPATAAVAMQSGPKKESALQVYRLDALITQRFSVPRMTLFMHPKDMPQQEALSKGMSEQLKRLPAQAQAGEYFVAVQLVQGGKFKLLGLASC